MGVPLPMFPGMKTVFRWIADQRGVEILMCPDEHFSPLFRAVAPTPARRRTALLTSVATSLRRRTRRPLCEWTKPLDPLRGRGAKKSCPLGSCRYQDGDRDDDGAHQDGRRN